MFKRIKGYFRKKPGVRLAATNVVDLGLLDLFNTPFRGDDWAATVFGALQKKREKKKRITVQPIDIIHDLEYSVDFPKEKLKEAAKDLTKRIKFMKKTLNTSTTDEIRALNMLNARLKYPKVAHLFIWKTTTVNHIQKLLDKYDLNHKDVREYVRSIPQLAIQAMEVYTNILSKVTKSKPEFSLIAPTKYFKDPKNYTDPILLASSPFGNYYYILTAWDKEISMVSELLDGEELVIDKNGNGKVERKK